MNILSGDSRLCFDENGKIIGFSEDGGYVGLNPFRICVQGLPEGQFSELTSANCLISESFKLIKNEQENGGEVFVYYNGDLGLRVTCRITPVEDMGVFRFVTGVENVGERSVEITRLSSAFVTGFGGTVKQKTPDYTVHYFESCWQAEARHVQKSLKELGLTFVSTHAMVKAFTLASQGAYTTAKYMPSIYVENKRGKKMHFLCAECDGSWRIQYGHAAGYVGHNVGWYLESEAISASDLGTSLMLEKGDSYTAPTVLVGSVNGGFDEATEALTNARRKLYLGKVAPLMFNDYMNCLWCNVNAGITEKLAKKAASLGVEGYCIDSGWFVPTSNAYGKLGDWTPNDERFAPYGLKGIIDMIKELGLVPGLWTELEVCSENAEAFNLPDEYFILSNGVRVGGGERYFFNMKNAAVREYLTQKVAAIYDMGVRYIKNDFNAALRWTSDADVINENQRHAMQFYSELNEKFPDLYVENCGSGGMRADYGMLKNFCIQSTSDQEIYYYYPSIAQGMLANILPEHAGIWSFPYPNLFDLRSDEIAMEREAERCANGRQTVFNMVTAIAGNLYLSGRIDYADDFNSALIAEGIEYFKSIRPFKSEASAVFPNGFADISSLGEFATLGLINREKGRLLIFFWKYGGKKTEFKVPVKKWMKNRTSLVRVYPKDYDITAVIKDGNVVITAQEQYSAGIFQVDFD